MPCSPGAGIEAVAGELVRGSVAKGSWQRGKQRMEPREAGATCVNNTPAVGQGASRAGRDSSGHLCPQPHGERHSQAALHQARCRELEQDADHRREGEDAAEQVGGVRQALDMGGQAR